MRYILSLLFAVLSSVGYADTFTVGRRGINAAGFKLPNGQPLDGEGIGVGMVEDDRPGMPGYDLDTDVYNTAVRPHKVFQQSGNAPVNGQIDQHAQGVGGIIIGDGSVGGASRGVAPDAKLYAGAAFPDVSSNDVIETIHKIATYPISTENPDVKVINMSYSWELFPPNELYMDGNYDLTQYVDWSASRHDILYVIAGPSLSQNFPASPSDQFNGLTVGASQTTTENGQSVEMYRQSAYLNHLDDGFDAAGDRVSIDILAPGTAVEMADMGNGSWTDDGTSMAAPHVAGAAALLQQYGNYKIQHFAWNVNSARRHEVMKAVILNSADKIEGIHGSQRTIKAFNDAYGWADRPAANDPAVPLAPWMGAGHLNVGAALKNYRAGEWDHGGVVPNIGWDYDTIGGAGSYNVYQLNRPLAAGEVVAATLCWDIRVETINPISDNHLDGFFDYQDLSQVLNDLDIYLMPTGGDPDDINDIIWGSVSSVDNEEHVFIPVPSSGFYQLVVANTNFGLGISEDYGFAWWAGEAIPGDFDGDGDVDDDDLPTWKTGYGTSESDADGDGNSDGADFLAWQRNYGFNVPPVVAVPEPTSWTLGCFGLLLLWRRRCMAAVSVAAIAVTGHPVDAATATFTRQSRPATPAEVADGVPSGSIVHDFFATTDADILCVATSFHSPVFKHRYGSEYSPPEQELVNLFPALGASSYLDTPGGTFTLGGNLSTDAEKAWADLSDDGPQESFQFGRLTTAEIGTFSGWLALRGEGTYFELPFSFTLVDEQGPTYEELTVFAEEPEIPVYVPPMPEPTPPVAPPEPMFPDIVPTFSLPLNDGQSALALKRSRMGDDFKFSGVILPAPDSAWPLPLPISAAVNQIPEPSTSMLVALGLPLLLRRRSTK